MWFFVIKICIGGDEIMVKIYLFEIGLEEMLVYVVILSVL